MSNEELKKKICKIIADNYLPKEMPDRLEDYKLYRFERAAEALIAAGIGDVESWKISDADKERSSINYYCEMREWKDKCKEAEHRADAAEQVLHDFAKLLGMGDAEKEEELYNNWLNGAKKKLSEKELAEDGKNE